MRIAVVGGTGVVGRHVVEAVNAAGHEASVVARSSGADLVSGDGLAAALESAEVVIDVANTSSNSRRKSMAFFERATTNLLRAEREAGVGHHVALSIVGIDEVDLGYYRAKRRQEELIRGGSVPWTMLRATQFHEFPAQLADRMKGPLLPVPTMTTQPVAAREVAQFLVELAMAEPSGTMSEIAGPEVRRMPDLARGLLRTRGSHRFVVPVRLPGKVGAAMAGGGLLPTGDFRRGTQTFADWLGESEADPGSRPAGEAGTARSDTQ